MWANNVSTPAISLCPSYLTVWCSRVRFSSGNLRNCAAQTKDETHTCCLQMALQGVNQLTGKTHMCMSVVDDECWWEFALAYRHPATKSVFFSVIRYVCLLKNKSGTNKQNMKKVCVSLEMLVLKWRKYHRWWTRPETAQNTVATNVAAHHWIALTLPVLRCGT